MLSNGIWPRCLSCMYDALGFGCLHQKLSQAQAQAQKAVALTLELSFVGVVGSLGKGMLGFGPCVQWTALGFRAFFRQV